jgi:hypothetical protein
VERCRGAEHADVLALHSGAECEADQRCFTAVGFGRDRNADELDDPSL